MGTFIGFVGVVLGILTVGLVLGFMLSRNLAATKELHELIEKHERERVEMKCTRLFSRLLRALYKEDLVFGQMRAAPDRLDLVWFNGSEDIVIHVAVRPESGPGTPGQYIAWAENDIARHGCEDDIRMFAKLIRQMFDVRWAASKQMANTYCSVS